MAKWAEKEWQHNDLVNKPLHYNQNGEMECIEAIEALITTMDQKYALEKAEWYLHRLIKKYKEVHK